MTNENQHSPVTLTNVKTPTSYDEFEPAYTISFAIGYTSFRRTNEIAGFLSAVLERHDPLSLSKLRQRIKRATHGNEFFIGLNAECPANVRYVQTIELALEDVTREQAEAITNALGELLEEATHEATGEFMDAIVDATRDQPRSLVRARSNLGSAHGVSEWHSDQTAWLESRPKATPAFLVEGIKATDRTPR